MQGERGRALGVRVSPEWEWRGRRDASECGGEERGIFTYLGTPLAASSPQLSLWIDCPGGWGGRGP